MGGIKVPQATYKLMTQDTSAKDKAYIEFRNGGVFGEGKDALMK